MVFRANGKNLYWQEIKSETIALYTDCLKSLAASGFKFKSFSIDGRRGVIQALNKLFPQTPIQLCHFYQIQMVTRYLSRRPKLEASRELRQLALTLSTTDRQTFTGQLQAWGREWKTFLEEKQKNLLTRRWRFVHRRLRSAYCSLKNNLPYLFACLDFPELKIPNTTNSCDGSFAHWKQKVKIHRGLSRKRRKKMIDYLLENS